MNKFRLIWIFSTLLNLISCQELSFGKCPPFPVEQNFDAMRYSGLWYEYSNYFAFFQLFGKCVTAFYSIMPGYGKNPKIGVLNRSVNEISGMEESAEGEAVLSDPYDPTKSAELIVNFRNQPAFARSRTTNYNVVSTDYHTYSIVYSCSQIAFLKSEFLWLLTRDRSPDPYLIKNLYSKIRFFGLDTRRLRVTDQRNCPFVGPIKRTEDILAVKSNYLNQTTTNDDDEDDETSLTQDIEHPDFERESKGQIFWPPS